MGSLSGCAATLRRLSWNALRARGGLAICASLLRGSVSAAAPPAGFSCLTALDLSWAGVEDAAAERLAQFLQRSPALTSLALAHNRLGLRSATALAACLPLNARLLRLEVCAPAER